MKILHLLASTEYSGAEHVAIDIIQSLTQKYDFLYASPNGSIENVLKNKNVKFYGLQKLSYMNVYKLYKLYKPDIIHAHDYRASCIAAMLPYHVKIVSHIHNNNKWAKYLNLRTIAYRLALLRFKKIVTVSDAVIDEFRFKKKLLDKAEIISNVINENNIIVLSKALAEKCNFLFIGRFAEPKNPLRFVKLINILRQEFPTVRAVMLGSGDLLEQVEVYIHREELDNNIKLLGFVDNPYKYIRRSDALILPSRWEGFGLVALEAMLLGKPVFCSSVGGLRNLVGGFNTNWLCEKDMDFIGNMKKIILSKDHYECESIIDYARKINNCDEFVNKWDNLYSNL
ncbi:glycosyltransferase [Pectinatus frisingensis]|uniref:glycosyltransferase n=1 Tax=Pectinatus frisingensis TaxID=865 RepID=UPI0015F5A5A4|nr:glycosyltransferase [Pectinatus frisingensis]